MGLYNIRTVCKLCLYDVCIACVSNIKGLLHLYSP